MKIVFCWDDGAKEDLKLIEYHKKYQIPGMFFVPTINKEGRSVLGSEELIEASKTELIKFGGHTQNHVYLKTLPISNVMGEVLQNVKYLENTLQCKIKHFCFPGGSYNKKIIKIIEPYFDTLRTADTCSFRIKKNKILKPSIHFYNRGKKSLLLNCIRHASIREFFFILFHIKKDYFDLIKDIIDFESKKSESQIIIWGHSWEIEEFQLWDKLDLLFDYLKKNYSDSIVTYDKL